MKKILIIVTLLIITVGGSILVYNLSKDKVKITSISGNAIANFKDRKNLVGYSNYVFFGEVIQNQGQEEWHVPVTKFKVKILDQIKGKLTEEEVSMYQYGGYDKYDKEGNTLILFENNPLLEVNQTYVFAVLEQENGKLLILPGEGYVKVDTKNTIVKLKSEFIDAFKNQNYFVKPGKEE